MSSVNFNFRFATHKKHVFIAHYTRRVGESAHLNLATSCMAQSCLRRTATVVETNADEKSTNEAYLPACWFSARISAVCCMYVFSFAKCSTRQVEGWFISDIVVVIIAITAVTSLSYLCAQRLNAWWCGLSGGCHNFMLPLTSRNRCESGWVRLMLVKFLLLPLIWQLLMTIFTTLQWLTQANY